MASHVDVTSDMDMASDVASCVASDMASDVGVASDVASCMVI